MPRQAALSPVRVLSAVFLGAALAGCAAQPPSTSAPASRTQASEPSTGTTSSLEEDTRISFAVTPDEELFAGSSQTPRELLVEARDQVLQTMDLYASVFGEWALADSPLLQWKGLMLTRASQRTQTYALDGSVGVVVGSGRAGGSLTQTLSTYTVSLVFQASEPLDGRAVFRYRPALTLGVTDALSVQAGGKLAIVDDQQVPWLLRGALKAVLQTLNADLEATGKSDVTTNFAAEFLDGPSYAPGKVCSTFMLAVAKDVLAPLCLEVRGATGADAAALEACRVDVCERRK
jgi:hypothetical protein